VDKVSCSISVMTRSVVPYGSCVTPHGPDTVIEIHQWFGKAPLHFQHRFGLAYGGRGNEPSGTMAVTSATWNMCGEPTD